MIYHLIEASPYTKTFVEFIRRNPKAFPPDDHRFVIHIRKGSLGPHWPEPDRQIIHLTGKFQFISLLGTIREEDSVVLHGLFSPWLTLALLLRPLAMSRSLWAIWGGDLYFYQYTRGLKDAIFEWLRHIVLPRLPYIVTFLSGDLDTARTVYRCQGRHLDAFYPNPIDYGSLPRFRPKSSGAPKTFLVGNSAALTNNHITALLRLERFEPENIEVICPLSYGGNPEYVRQVIDVGQELFGKKFVPLLDYLPADEYLDILERVDVAVLDFRRQQGIGNILVLVAMGKPIYMSKDNSVFVFLREQGIEVHDTASLLETQFDHLPSPSEQKAKAGRHFILSQFSEERAVQQWSNVFMRLAGDDPPACLRTPKKQARSELTSMP